MARIYVDDYIKDRECAAEGIRKAIDQAALNENTTLVFSGRKYYLNHPVSIETASIAHDDGCGDIHEKECYFVLKNQNGLTVEGTLDDEGNPSTILIGENTGRIQERMPSVFWAENCSHLTVKNIAFTREPETACSGVIEEIRDDEIIIYTEQDLGERKELGAYCMNRFLPEEKKLIGKSLTIGFGYDKRFQRINAKTFLLKDGEIAQKVNVAEGLSFHQSGLTDFLLFFGKCDNLKLYNIHIKNTNGFGILTENCCGIQAEKVWIKPPKYLYFTGPRDGWKIYRCSGKIEVRNCHFEGVRMDGQNVQSNYLTVEKQIDSYTLVCRCKYAPVPLKTGTRIEAESTGRSYTIKSWMFAGEHMENAVQEKDISAGKIVRNGRNHISYYQIQFEENVADVKAGNLMQAMCWEPESYLCENSVFKNIAGAANLIRCKNAVIENNRYENIMCAGVMIGAERDTHLECGHGRHITVRNNVFCNVGFSPRYGVYGCACIAVKSQGFHGPYNEDIQIYNNKFQNSKTAMEIRDAKNVRIFGNQYDRIEKRLYLENESCENIIYLDSLNNLEREDQEHDSETGVG